jgi:hypothetical protein
METTSLTVKEYRCGSCIFRGTLIQESVHSRTEDPVPTEHLAKLLKSDKLFKQSLHQKEISLDLDGGKALA